MTLRFKTIVAVGLVEVVVLVALGYSTLTAMQRSVTAEFQGRTQATHQLLASVAKDALIAFDLARLDGVIEQVVKNDDVAYVGVSAGGQWVSFAGIDADIGARIDLAPTGLADQLYDTREAVEEAGTVFGQVHIGFDVSAIQNQMDTVRARFGVIAVIGLLTSAALSYVFGSWLSRRAQRLINASERLGRGDFNALMVDRGRDEFADLSRSFNHMAERLRSEAEQRERALTQARDNEAALKIRSDEVERYNQLSNLLNVIQLNVILNPLQQIYSPALTDDLLELTDSEVGFIASIDEIDSDGVLPINAWADRSGSVEISELIKRHTGFARWKQGQADEFGFESVGHFVSSSRKITEVIDDPELARHFRYGAFLPVIQRGQVTAMFGFLRSSAPYNETLENFIQPLITTCSQLADAAKNNVARVQAEQELQTSEATIRSILESADDAIMTLTESGVVASANRGAGKVFGIASDELIGLWFGELLDTQRRMQITQDGVGVLLPEADGEVLNLEAHRLSGGTVPIEMSLSPMALEGENLYTAVVRDVTEKRQAQEALKRYSNQLDSILSLSGDGFIAFDSAGRVGYANPAFEKLFDVDCKAEPAQTMESLSRRLVANSENWQLALADLADGQSYRIKVLKPAQRYLQVTARTMLGDDGESLGKVMYFQDVTHQTEVDRMKSEFLSTAAHELRTPLASVYGFSELLMSIDYDKETRNDLLETIHKQASRLTKLIDELLDLARIEARAGKEFDIKSGDLRGFLQDLSGSFVMQNDDRLLAVELPDQLPAVAFDEDKLAQAVSNIISNAYKYSPDGGDISLSAIQVGHQVGIQVQDSGLGMSDEAVKRIYDRFYRADPSCNIPGTGLGMSVVKEIIDIHGGQIDIESESGQGTTVTLWLPQDQQLAVG